MNSSLACVLVLSTGFAGLLGCMGENDPVDGDQVTDDQSDRSDRSDQALDEDVGGGTAATLNGAKDGINDGLMRSNMSPRAAPPLNDGDLVVAATTVTTAAADATVSHAPSEHIVDDVLAAERDDDAYALRLVCLVLDRQGYRAGDCFAVPDLAARLGSRPLYTKLLSRRMMELQAAGVTVPAASGSQLGARFAAVLDGHRRARTALPSPYWRQTAEQLVAVLRGGKHILELMVSGPAAGARGGRSGRLTRRARRRRPAHTDCGVKELREEAA